MRQKQMACNLQRDSSRQKRNKNATEQSQMSVRYEFLAFSDDDLLVALQTQHIRFGMICRSRLSSCACVSSSPDRSKLTTNQRNMLYTKSETNCIVAFNEDSQFFQILMVNCYYSIISMCFLQRFSPQFRMNSFALCIHYIYD